LVENEIDIDTTSRYHRMTFSNFGMTTENTESRAQP